MAGITLRMSGNKVRTILGVPVRTTKWRGALGNLVIRLHYRRVVVDLERLQRIPVVIRVLTMLPGERTASGVGVGSPRASVEGLKGAHCWREGSANYCGIGNRNKPGSPFTMFWIGPKQRVTLISVSLSVNS
jgi:hypothetical protein